MFNQLQLPYAAAAADDAAAGAADVKPEQRPKHREFLRDQVPARLPSPALPWPRQPWSCCCCHCHSAVPLLLPPVPSCCLVVTVRRPCTATWHCHPGTATWHCRLCSRKSCPLLSPSCWTRSTRPTGEPAAASRQRSAVKCSAGQAEVPRQPGLGCRVVWAAAPSSPKPGRPACSALYPTCASTCTACPVPPALYRLPCTACLQHGLPEGRRAAAGAGRRHLCHPLLPHALQQHRGEALGWAGLACAGLGFSGWALCAGLGWAALGCVRWAALCAPGSAGAADARYLCACLPAACVVLHWALLPLPCSRPLTCRPALPPDMPPCCPFPCPCLRC